MEKNGNQSKKSDYTKYKKYRNKAIIYTSAIGTPLFICIFILVKGFENDLLSNYQIATTVSFTMFGVLVGLYSSHRTTQLVLEASIIHIFGKPEDSKAKWVTEEVNAIFILFYIIAYFIVGFISLIMLNQ